MEMVYPRIEKTNTAAVYLREMGSSRIVYFPWDIERTFWESLCVDHRTLLANAIAWSVNEEQPVTVTGPGLLDITVWRQKESMTVHLVNLTNPMTMKGPFREFFAVPEQRVKVRLPENARVKNVHLLVRDQMPQSEVTAGYITVTVPSILDHEVIAIDFEN